MVSFTHVIQGAAGLHARPVTTVCRFAMDHANNVITVAKGASCAMANDMLGLMGLNAYCGDTLEVQVDGSDSVRVAEELHALMEREL